MSAPKQKSQMSLPRRNWPAFVIAGLLLLFFWPYLLLDQTLFAGDTAFVFLPFREFVQERLLNGQIPLWNPYLMGGTPALAEGTHQVFYWPNVILMALGVPRGMGWTLPIHLALMATGMYYFTRYSLGLSRPGALCVALVFCFAGGTQSRLAISVYTQAAAWMPWIFLSYDYARRRGGVALLLPGLPLAMQLFTGGLPFTYYTLCLFLAYHCFQVWDKRKNPEQRLENTLNAKGKRSLEFSQKLAWAALATTLIVGLCLSAVQMIPEYELAQLSDRSTKASYDYVTLFSLTPQHFALTTLFPKYYGLFSTTTLDNFVPGEETGYLGVMAIGLIGAAFASSSRRQVLFWSGIFVVTVFIAFGRYNPLYHFLYDYVPGFAMFRAPARWMLLSSFAAAVLAGLGVEALLKNNEQRSRALRNGFVVLLLGTLASLTILLLPLGRETLQIEQSPFGPWGQVTLWAASALAFGFFWLYTRKTESKATQEKPLVVGRTPKYAYAAIIAFLSFDYFALSQDMEWLHILPVSQMQEPSPTAQFLRSRTPHERFWSPKPQVPMERWQAPTAFGASTPNEHRAVAARAVQTLMPSCIPAQYQTLGLTGAWGSLMPTRRHAKPIYEPKTPPEVQQRWLRLLNVRYYLSLRPLDDTSLQLLTQEPVYIYEDAQALPRAFIVNNARIVRPNNASALVGSEDFNPRQEVLLEEVTANIGAIQNASRASAPATSSNAQANVLSVTPHMIDVETQTQTAGYLVMMDSVYPGWRATVNNIATEIKPANWMGRAVPIPSGTTKVRFWFEPQSYRVGLFISLLTLGVLAFFIPSLLQHLRLRRSLPKPGN